MRRRFESRASFALGTLMFLGVLVLNGLVLAAGIWIAVTMLRAMGVIS